MRFRNDIHKRRFEKEIKKNGQERQHADGDSFSLDCELGIMESMQDLEQLDILENPFCDFVQSAVNHLCVKVKEVEDNIAEVPSVINAVWLKTFRITAKRRKSPHYRQRARRPNKENRHRTRKTLYRCLFFFSKLRKY